jgi:hypothetical protein
MKITVFLITAVLFFSSVGFAQQEILMNSGEQRTAYEVKIDDQRNVLFYTDKKGKVKWEDLEDVFSLTRTDSVHIIFYKADCEDVCFKTHQMREYLNGYAAGEQESAFWPFIFGAATGSGFSYVLVNAGLSVLAPLPPAVNAMIFGSIRPKPENFEALDAYKDNEHYTEGYIQRIKRKRTVYSILGGAVGILGGGAGAILLK